MERRDYLRAAGATGVATVGGYGVYTALFRETGTSRDRGGDTEYSAEDYDAETRDGWTLLGVTPSDRDALVLEPFEEWLGKTHAVAGTFIDMDHSDGDIERLAYGLLEASWEHGRVPHVFWQPFFPADDPSQEVNQEIANGEYDDRLEAWGEVLADWAQLDDGPDRRVYLNLAPEFNGDWSPWSPAQGGESEDDFVAMWRHVHDLISDAGLGSDHVQWIWTLDNTTKDVDEAAAYPGDEYVDWAGIHGYNWTNWEPWQSAADVYGETIETVREITDKPIAITEFGSSSETEDGDHDPERKDEWIADAYDYLEEEDVRMTMYFNMTTETDWAVFDAEYGADTAEVDGNSYEVYPAYREAVTADGVLGSHPDHPRRLTDEEFAGEF